MRDPKRIPKVLEVVKERLDAYPNTGLFSFMEAVQEASKNDGFYVEDAVLAGYLDGSLAIMKERGIPMPSGSNAVDTERMLEEVRRLWEEVSDWRFMQLVCNAQRAEAFSKSEYVSPFMAELRALYTSPFMAELGNLVGD